MKLPFFKFKDSTETIVDISKLCSVSKFIIDDKDPDDNCSMYRIMLKFNSNMIAINYGTKDEAINDYCGLVDAIEAWSEDSTNKQILDLLENPPPANVRLVNLMKEEK